MVIRRPGHVLGPVAPPCRRRGGRFPPGTSGCSYLRFLEGFLRQQGVIVRETSRSELEDLGLDEVLAKKDGQAPALSSLPVKAIATPGETAIQAGPGS